MPAFDAETRPRNKTSGTSATGAHLTIEVRNSRDAGATLMAQSTVGREFVRIELSNAERVQLRQLLDDG